MSIVGDEIHLLDASGQVINNSKNDTFDHSTTRMGPHSPSPPSIATSSPSVSSLSQNRVVRPIDRLVVSLEGVKWSGSTKTDSDLHTGMEYIDSLKDAWTVSATRLFFELTFS